MKALLTIGLLALVLVAVFPAFQVGFLADDFYMAEKIAASAEARPALSSRIHDAFFHQWTESFDVFRPLTILSLQWDHGVLGPDGDLHHLTNILLWFLCALCAALAARRFAHLESLGSLVVLTLIFGCWPAGIETIGWLVAREDLFCAIPAALVLYTLLGQTQRPLRVAGLCAIALCAKETAVVIPPLVLATDFLLSRQRADAPRGFSSRVRYSLRTHWPSLLILGSYFGLRRILFGTFLGTYNQKSYLSYLVEEGALERIGKGIFESLTSLLAPINDQAWDRLFGVSIWVPTALLLAPHAILLLTSIRRSRKSNSASGPPSALTGWLIALTWCLAPLLLLTIPLGGVERDLNKSRFLVIPMIAWLCLIARALRPSIGSCPRPALLAATALIALGIGSFHVCWSSYHRASDRAEKVLGDVRELVTPGSRTLLLGTENPRRGGGVHPKLTFHEGCHVLSAGLFHAFRPPFEDPPGRDVAPILDADRSRLASFLDASSKTVRPNLLLFDPASLSWTHLAEAGFYGGKSRVEPAHQARIPVTWDATFRIATRPALLRTYTRGVLRIVDALGSTGTYEFAPTDVTQDDGPDGMRAMTIKNPPLRVRSGKGRFQTPDTRTVMAALPHRQFFWWVELYKDDHLTFRSSYAAVTLVP